MEQKELVQKMYINFLNKGLYSYAEDFKQELFKLKPGQSLFFDGALIKCEGIEVIT